MPSAFAIGLAQDYLENKTVFVQPGEQVIHNLELQNPHGQQVQVNVSLQGPYVSFNNNQQDILVTLPAQQLRTHVPILIEVDKNATKHTTHRVVFRAQPIPSEDGMVSVGVRLSGEFFIQVTSSPGFFEQARKEFADTTMSWGWLHTSALFIAAIILVLFLYKKSFVIASKASSSNKQSYQELIELIQSISEQEFVNSQENNTLSEWVYAHTRNQAVANKLSQAKSKHEAIRVLSNEL